MQYGLKVTDSACSSMLGLRLTEKEKIMANKKSNERRRKLLKSVAAGSGAIIAGKSLPESWARPIVDSVILPAHALTTNTTDTVPNGLWEGTLNFTGVTTANNSDSVGSFSQLLLDTLVPPAYACVEGDIHLSLLIRPSIVEGGPQIAELSNSVQFGQSTVQGLNVEIPKININGQLSNASATYIPFQNKWNLFIEGLDNGFACKGNNARGLLILVTPTIVNP